MASTPGFGGFQPDQYLNGATWNDQTREYPIASGYGTSLFTGDPVILLTDGTIGKAVPGTGNPILGVFFGVKYPWTQNTPAGNFIFQAYWLAGTTTQAAVNATALIVDDPNVIFSLYVNADSFAQANLNKNYNYAAGAGGNTMTGQSSAVLDFAGGPVGATGQLKAIGFDTVVNNNINVTSGTSTKVLCIINNHVYKGGTGTAGI